MSYDAFKESYLKTKLNLEEMRTFKEFQKYSDEELLSIAEEMFDLAVLLKKIIFNLLAYI